MTGSVAVLQGTNPFIITGSVQGSFTPSGNQSVSGTVQVDVRGSVATVIIGGSIAASFTPPANQSVSGTVNVGNFPTTQNVSGSVAALVTNTVTVVSSLAGGIFPISGSVAAVVTNFPLTQNVSGSVAAWLQSTNASVITVGSPVANQSVSGTVGASLIGLSPVSVSNFPTNQNVSGSVVAFQGTNPWAVANTGSIAAVIIGGSIAASFTPPANQSVSGTVTVGSLLAMPGIVSSANSTITPVTSTLSFTGTGEEWKDFGTISINVFTDAVSATDGLSIQQSSDNTNWDIRDTYTIPSMASGGGKAFQVQPAARYGRIVYTQGAQNSGAFRLQTVYHPQQVKPSSQRPQDAYSNETDLEQAQAFNMVYNGSTWDRQRGSATDGTIIKGSIQGTVSVLGTVPVTQATSPWVVSGNIGGSVVSFQGGTTITSISGTVPVAFVGASIAGTYAEDSAHTTAQNGLFVLGVRNDTVSSFTSANTDYGPFGTDSAGRLLTKPFAAGEASLIAYGSLVSSGTTGSVQVFAAPGAGLRNYITDFNFSNTGAATTLVTIGDRDASVLAKTIAPAGGGSNHSYQTPVTSATANLATGVQIATSSSVVHFTISGFKAP